MKNSWWFYKERFKALAAHVSPGLWMNYIYRASDPLSLDLKKLPEPELLLLDYFLCDDHVFFDVGANLGYYIKRALSSRSVSIYAFEPIPFLGRQLERLFPKVHVFSLALSDRNTTKELFVPMINGQPFYSRSSLEETPGKPVDDKPYVIAVPTSTLDAFVDQHNIDRIDVIKIDVEGHEWEVIWGGRKSLEKWMPIMIVEIFAVSPKQQEYVIQRMKSWGYLGYYFDVQQRQLVRVDSSTKKSDLFNYIFIPEQSNRWNVDSINAKLVQ